MLLFCPVLTTETPFFTHLSKTSLDHLQVVQNAAAKLLTRSSEREHETQTLTPLHWLPMTTSELNVRLLLLPVKTCMVRHLSACLHQKFTAALLFLHHSRFKSKGEGAFQLMAQSLERSIDPSVFFILYPYLIYCSYVSFLFYFFIVKHFMIRSRKELYK